MKTTVGGNRIFKESEQNCATLGTVANRPRGIIVLGFADAAGIDQATPVSILPIPISAAHPFWRYRLVGFTREKNQGAAVGSEFEIAEKPAERLLVIIPEKAMQA